MHALLSLSVTLLARAEAGPAAEAAECRLRAMVQEGRAAWPELPLPDAVFVDHVAERAPPGPDLAAALSTLCAADLYLACACVRGVPGAIAAFDGALIVPIAPRLRHIDPSPSFADEVRQRVRERLLVSSDGAPPRLSEYAGRAALSLWVRTVALRIALNLRTRVGAPHAAEGAALDQAVGLDPEADYLKRRFQQEFREAFEASLSALAPQERTLLRMHFVDGLNLDRLGQAFQVNPSTISRRLAGLRQTLARQTRRLLQQRLHLRPSELDSLAGVVRSQLDHVVAGLLRQERE